MINLVRQKPPKMQEMDIYFSGHGIATRYNLMEWQRILFARGLALHDFKDEEEFNYQMAKWQEVSSLRTGGNP